MTQIHMLGSVWGNYKPKPKPHCMCKSLNHSGCIHIPAKMRPALGQRDAFSAGERELNLSSASHAFGMFLIWREFSTFSSLTIYLNDSNRETLMQHEKYRDLAIPAKHTHRNLVRSQEAEDHLGDAGQSGWGLKLGRSSPRPPPSPTSEMRLSEPS